MDFVSNIWKKTPFKSEVSEEGKEEIEGEPKNEPEKKDESSASVGVGAAGVGFVSNILKSTFKGESNEPVKEAKEGVEGEEEPKNEGDGGATGGFMSSVWRTTSLFRSETVEGKERKESVSSDTEKKDENTGASGFMSSVWKTTSLFKGDANDKRLSTDATEAEKEAVTQGDEDEAAKDAASAEAVSQKAIDSAKNIGNFLYSVANKAGQTVTATAKQLKHTVEHNTFLADFTKEQQEFIKEHGGNIDVGEPPWVGCEDEEEVKKQILTLSQDKRNFVRSPPSGVQFDFDMQQMLPVALGLLKEDENLGKMRFEIVPKLVNEETFWRNYFYRVSLIKQSTSLSNINKECKGWASSSSSSAEGPDEPSPTNPEAEFISDSIQGTVTDEDLRKGMRQLGVDKNRAGSTDDKHWEDELTKDLQEFEVVNSDHTILDAELEKDLAEL